jgi:zinc D-Ala-D-Ala carboxypeptidase
MRFRPLAGHRTVAARVILAAALVGIPLAAPTTTVAVGPLPDCRLDDVLTVPRGYDEWSTTLVDWILTLGPKYEPRDLVSVRDGGVAGGGYVREVVIEDLRAMAAAAEDNGTPLVAWSPYRGYWEQRALFRSYARGYGFKEAIKFSARPGHSEHQLGLTIDFVAVGDTGLTSNWEVTPTGAWMAENAWQYGWLMSYPKGKRKLTCYSYEPWHYRYVGRDLAREIHDSGLTPREYLWANFTQVDLPGGEPSSSPAASPSTSPLPPESPGASPQETDPPSQRPPTGAPATAPPDGGPVSWLDQPTLIVGLLALIAALVLVGALRFGRSRRP